MFKVLNTGEGFLTLEFLSSTGWSLMVQVSSGSGLVPDASHVTVTISPLSMCMISDELPSTVRDGPCNAAIS